MKIRQCVKNAMKTLGIKKLKQGQLKPINRILDGKDTMLIAATSFGKSMVALIPAVVCSKKLTIIVEPLIALMHDQVNKLKKQNISASYLDSTQSKDEQEKVCEMLRNRALTVLYLAPERLNKECLPSELYCNDIYMVVIDECHCVVNWGYTFREDYLRIGEFIDSLKERPVVVAMTASAPPEDRDEIMKLLSMKDAKCLTASLYRRNLQFLKKSCTSRLEQRKLLLKTMKKFHKHTTIVFCSTKSAVKGVSQDLRKKYPDEVITYHSKDKHYEREMFSDSKHIVVATSALAMGVDIRNVDLVILFNFPLSIPDYYQMSGRAGREGQKARSVLIYNPDDYWTNFGLLENIEDADAKAIAMERLDAMKEFCEDTKSCMVTSMLRELGDNKTKSCRYCTNCQKAR